MNLTQRLSKTNNLALMSRCPMMAISILTSLFLLMMMNHKVIMEVLSIKTFQRQLLMIISSRQGSRNNILHCSSLWRIIIRKVAPSSPHHFSKKALILELLTKRPFCLTRTNWSKKISSHQRKLTISCKKRRL